MEVWAWVSRPEAAFASPFLTKQTSISTGPKLVTRPQPLPYKIEASGFLSAIDRYGGLTEKNQVGLVGVVADNVGVALGRKPVPECMQILVFSGEFFLARLE